MSSQNIPNFRLDDFLDVTTDAVVLIDREQRILLFNRSAEEIFGYQSDEIVGQTLDRLIPPRFADIHRQHIHSFGEGPESVRPMAQRREIAGMRKDGSEFPAEASIAKIERGGELYFMVFLRDITRRKQGEAALRESELRYTSIIAALEEGVLLQDRKGKIYTCNESAERILGLSQEQLLSRTSTDPRWRSIREDGTPFPGEEHPAMVTLRTGKACASVIMGVYKPDGVLTWISINTRPLFHPGEDQPYAVLSSFSNITERMQLYQLLERRVEVRTRELSALLELSRHVASTMEIQPLLTQILNQLKTVVDYHSAGIAVIDEDQAVMLEYQGPLPRDQIVGQPIPLSQDVIFREVVDRRAPSIIDDIWADDPRHRAAMEQSNNWVRAFLQGAHSWMGIPLIVKDTLIGVLRLDHSEPNHYTEEHARLTYAFAEQAAIGIEKARLYEQAQSLAALQERQKLARELHDSVSQALYGIGLGTRTALALVQRDPAKAVEPLQYCLSLAEAALAEMRALIFELRPESLELEGLVAALSKQAAAIQARYSIQVLADLCDEPEIPLGIKETLYRISQEALNNVVKHAQASQVDLRLAHPDGLIVLEVQDNGLGFDPAAAYPGHLGLRSMRERAEKVKGRFEIKSNGEKGSKIRVEIPIPPHP